MRYQLVLFPANTNICTTFIQRRANVFDVGQTLYKCYTNVLCLQGIDIQFFLYSFFPLALTLKPLRATIVVFNPFYLDV